MNQTTEINKGVKHDLGKDQWYLLPLNVVSWVVKVLMFGANKYAPFNWQLVVKEKPQRYFDAAVRHLADYQSGERMEPESKLPTLAHAICCLIFILWNDINNGQTN